MKHSKCRSIFISTLCILLISLFGSVGCTNTQGNIILADYEEIPEKPPIELTIGQLYDDYMRDPMAAADEYEGKRFCFYEVTVEEVVESGSSGKQYFITDNVKFVLRSASKMQNIEPGYVLNLVGKCRGLAYASRDVVYINDCWAEGVNCDLGEDEGFDTY
jgi:hypothetical protein